MKNFLALPLLVLLTGCVSYYQPETAFEDGVYYAGDDPSYVLNSSDYSGVIVYPWSSLDYFYMGYGAYYGHYSAYSYPYGYYNHYWRPYRGYCAYQYNCRGDRASGDERYARHDGGRRRDRDAASELGDDTPTGRESDDDLNDNSSIKRYITTMPSGYSGNQGMVVRNSANSKIGKSHHIQPVKSTSANSSSVSVSSPALTARPSARSATNTSSGNRARPSSSSRSSARHSSSGNRARPSSSSRSSTRQSSKSSKSARRRDRD